MDGRRDRCASPAHWARALLCAAALWAGEGLAQTYAVLSLVGDRLTIVGEAQTAAGQVDRNVQQVVALKDTALDDFAAMTAKAVIEKAKPGASVTAFRARERSVYALRDGWLDADKLEVRELLAAIGDRIPASPNGRLLLIAPYKHQLELRTNNSYVGTGKASGLGFYVDATTRFADDKGNVGPGFLGVFANFQLALVNLDRKAIEAQRPIKVGWTVAAVRASDGVPWNALSAAEKIAALERLMKEEIERVLPEMLGTAK